MHDMEDERRLAITEKSREMMEVEDMHRWVQYIDRHVETGSDEHFYLRDEEALMNFTRLIGHETVSSEQILAYYYSATAFERLEDSGEALNFNGERTVIAIQEMLGNKGMNLEFPNDYNVKMAVALDAETMVIYVHESNASPVICHACASSRDPAIIQELAMNEHYSCEHSIDEYDTRDYALLVKIATPLEALRLLP